MNKIGTRISVTWSNRHEVLKLSLIFVGNIAIGLTWLRLL